MILRILTLLAVLVVASCTTFDRTNIYPGQTVPGLGFSFEVPTQNNWTAVEYGSGNKIHLFQLNDDDSYSIIVTLNRGPYFGMYRTAEAHLTALKRLIQKETKEAGYIEHYHREWVEPKYGELCVRYVSKAEDWRGRNKEGPALIDLVGLSCHHPEISNVIINTEISRRYEVDAQQIDLSNYADALFSSFDYHSL